MMSHHRTISLRRRIILSDKPVENRPCFMDTESDQDSSVHDVSSDFECVSSSSSPVNSSERYEDNTAEFLDLDLPIRSPGTPWISRRNRTNNRTTRNRNLSPIPFTLYKSAPFPDLDNIENNSNVSNSRPSPCSVSPPHRSLRALRLFDTPHTPKTLLQKCKKRTSSTKPRRSRHDSKLSNDSTCERPLVNTNPFTPDNNTVTTGHKRTRSTFDRALLEDSCNSTEDELEDEIPTAKKIALHEINTSRYNEEFLEINKLGDGEFGSVFKCIHRLDGCTYAIKKSKTPVAGSVYERNAMNEVYAHAVLGKHQHVVRYYSAWAENDYMYIQNEYCNGSSLADTIEEHQRNEDSQRNEDRRSGSKFTQDELKQVLFQCAKGLKYVHSLNLVHLDVKPGNIFTNREAVYSGESGLESNEEEDDCDDDCDSSSSVTYKIGDFGHVTSSNRPVVEEGDCRYLPKEILEENYDHLPKADIFSLGLTVYELASGESLPKNGPEWHAIRRGELPYLPQFSIEFNALLKSMVLPDPSLRPSAAQLTHNTFLCPQAKRTRAQLRKELNEERFKNEMLLRQLTEATKVLAGYTTPPLSISPPFISPHLSFSSPVIHPSPLCHTSQHTSPPSHTTPLTHQSPLSSTRSPIHTRSRHRTPATTTRQRPSVGSGMSRSMSMSSI